MSECRIVRDVENEKERERVRKGGGGNKDENKLPNCILPTPSLGMGNISVSLHTFPPFASYREFT